MRPLAAAVSLLALVLGAFGSAADPSAEESNQLEAVIEIVRGVVRSPDVPVDLRDVSPLAEESEGEWELIVSWSGLADEYRERAKAAGYSEADEVVIRVGTDGIRVQPKTYTFDVQVEEMTLPSADDPGGYLRMRAEMARIPPFLRDDAIRMGYEERELVRMEMRTSKESGIQYQVLPPPFILGFSQEFDALTRSEQKEAERLGYRSGDVVWRTIDDKGFRTISKIRAGDGPKFRIVGARNVDTPSGEVEMIPSCVARFDDLSDEWKKRASDLGYAKGDEVGFEWSMTRGDPRMVRADEILRNLE